MSLFNFAIINKKLLFICSILLFLTLFIHISTLKFFSPETVQKTKSQYASDIFNKCRDFKDKIVCYENEIAKLMDLPIELSMEEAFEVNDLIQEKDTQYAYCHVLGHKLATKETQKDPSRWKEVLNRCKPGRCANGCIHGAFQERFKKEYLTEEEIDIFLPEFATFCNNSAESSELTIYEQGSCFHAVGHLAMYVTRADIKSANEICEYVTNTNTTKQYRSLCQDGMFMQLFQPFDSDDLALVKNISPRKENVRKFCETFSYPLSASCRRESWPLFIDEIKTSQGAIDFCADFPGPNANSCYITLFYIIPVQFGMDMQSVVNYCADFKGESQYFCFKESARRFMQNDYSEKSMHKSIEMCLNAPNNDIKKDCLNYLIDNASRSYTLPVKEYFCRQLPAEVRNQCNE